MRKYALLIVAVLALGLGGIGIAAASPSTQPVGVPATALRSAATPLPVGFYSDGTVRVCVSSSSPYTVFGHSGSKTKACPAGTRVGVINVKGAKGDTGKAGAPGKNGVNGKDGKDGAAAPETIYGVGVVNVRRGAAEATPWSKVSTSVGGPVGDSASDNFRMTCSAAQAPCYISAGAYGTVSGVSVYPRLLITKESLDGGPITTCEYADGVNNNNGKLTVNANAETPLPLGIGGSLDCGSDQPQPDAGVVTEIKVPAGRYNIAASFVFSK